MCLDYLATGFRRAEALANAYPAVQLKTWSAVLCVRASEREAGGYAEGSRDEQGSCIVLMAAGRPLQLCLLGGRESGRLARRPFEPPPAGLGFSA